MTRGTPESTIESPSKRPSRALLTFLAIATLAQASGAQESDQRPTPLPAVGRSLAGNSDSTAIVQNPAALSGLGGPEFRYQGFFVGDTATTPEQGHTFAFALPLGFLPIATGLRLDTVTPNQRTAQQMAGRDFNYQWLTWALALGTEQASLGFSFEHSYSNITDFHNFGSWSLALNLRPLDYLGLAGVIHQIDAPHSESGRQLGSTYQMGAAFRPTGSNLLEIGAEASYVDERGGYWIPRAVVDVGIPSLGRLRGDIAVSDPAGNVHETSWVASTTLLIAANSRGGSAELGLGSRYGSGINPNSEDLGKFYENLQLDVAVRGFRSTQAAENVHYALRIRMESTPNTREHVALLRRLWEMAESEKLLDVVLLELRASPADSLAHLQELVDALAYLKQKGKKVLCHLEDGSGSALYLCSEADRLLLNPAGGIRYTGAKSSSFYVKGLLDKLGVHADFVRIGPHKSAPEMFVRDEASEVALSDKADLLQQVELELTSGIARGRHLDPAQFRKSVETAPFTAAEAKTAGLVDGFAFDDMLEDRAKEMSTEPLHVEEGGFGPVASDRFGPRQRLAIVYVEGDMVDGRSQAFPFVGIRTAGSYTIAESLKQVREDASVGAVVLRIETGGGSAMAADVIWREVQLTAQVKPVVVSMGTAAASGGYYIASPGTFIYANPLTITGSIGIFYGKFDVRELLKNIGVNAETLKVHPHADAEDIFRPFSVDERELLKRKIEQFYALFVERVASGRKLTREQVDEVGRGRVWTGRQARDHRLVDDVGGLRQAMAKARVLGGLRVDAEVLELPIPESSLLGKLLGVEGMKQELGQSVPLPAQAMEVLRAVAPLALYESDTPLARLEVLPNLMP